MTIGYAAFRSIVRGGGHFYAEWPEGADLRTLESIEKMFALQMEVVKDGARTPVQKAVMKLQNAIAEFFLPKPPQESSR